METPTRETLIDPEPNVRLSTPEPDDAPSRITLRKLHNHAMEGDWEAAKSILLANPQAKTERLNGVGMTALHVAAKCGRSKFVESLVKLLQGEDLVIEDQMSRTALHYAALAASVGAARAMVSKNRDLPQWEDVDGYTPLFYAARWRHPSKSREMVEYLRQVTNDQVFTTPDTAHNLIVAITASGSHDIALDVLKRYPVLTLKSNEFGWSILHILASQPSAFLSGTKLSLLESLIYPWINRVSEKQKRLKDSQELVEFVCAELQKKSDPDILDYFLPLDRPAILHLATEHGVFELVEACIRNFPDLIWYSSGDKRLLLHIAVEHRRVKIFNYIFHLIGENTGTYAGTRFQGHNNILHLAAKMAPTPQLHSVPGPAFQMQRELQWFKAVEALVYSEERVAKNIKEKTPIQLFFEEHENLLKDAKEWMKDTSNSCMVVAALVATVAFASMITVPGGSNNVGMPVLSTQRLFVIFSASNALSMLSAAFSLLTFLSLQTSRFTDKDFLESLPKNLLKGLVSLFVAVATMMVAFGTAIGLSLQTRLKWAYIPITIVACIPAIIFTRLQLPLLVQALVFTTGPGIFDGRMESKKWSLHKICDPLLSNDVV